ERPVTLFGQEARRHQAARAGADHYRPLGQRPSPWRGHNEWFFVKELHASPAAKAFHQAQLVVREEDLGGVDKLESVFVTGIETFAEDAPAQQLIQPYAEQPRQPRW